MNDTEFVQRVLSDKPEKIKDNNFVNDLYESIKPTEGRKTFKAAHFSDFHVDFEYVPGTNANCNMPLCCRAENGYPENPEDAAGEWGSYKCDPPHNTITKMFESIRDDIKPDVIFFTGDLTPHNVWENSEPEVIYY